MKSFSVAVTLVAASFQLGAAAAANGWWDKYQKIQGGMQDVLTKLQQNVDESLNQNWKQWGKFMNDVGGLDFGQQCDCDQRCKEAVQEALQPQTRQMRVCQVTGDSLRLEAEHLRGQLEATQQTVRDLRAALEKSERDRRVQQESPSCFAKTTFHRVYPTAEGPDGQGRRRRGVPFCATVLGLLLAVASVIAMRCWLCARAMSKRLEAMQQEVEVARAELVQELGEDVVSEAQTLGGPVDYPCFVEDDEVGETLFRRLRIECPGVAHGDIHVEGACNGCIVTIARGRRGTEPWTKRVQFRPSDGIFEFQEDLAELELGILTLVFKAAEQPPWVFRFPQHFDFDQGDKEMAWMLSSESSMPLTHETSTVRGESSLEPAEEPTEEDDEDGPGPEEEDEAEHEEAEADKPPEHQPEDESILGGEIDTDGSDAGSSEAPSLQDFEKL